MNTFAKAIQKEQNKTTTTNGARAFKSSGDKNVDLFGKIGASRGKDITALFDAAYAEEPELALRVLQWARDVRGGAGERELYRQVLKHLELKAFNSNNYDVLFKLIDKTPEIGRFDDLLIFKTPKAKSYAFDLIESSLVDGNGLAAKWMPRKGPIAVELRNHMGLTPKRYRKVLVERTKVVETQMCKQDWNNIDFGQVPSLAASRYFKAFYRNAPTGFSNYVNKLKQGTAKVNATALYPYNLTTKLRGYLNDVEIEFINAQWKALPNYIGDANILPMVDVSGSMYCAVGSKVKSDVTCIDVAISLGLYMADKNTGPFNGTFLTFSDRPVLQHLTGTIYQKYNQMHSANWDMNTDVERAFAKVLEHATNHRVPQKDMPKYLVILSDMQFDQCVRNGNDTALKNARKQFNAAGYDLPTIVFWNIKAYDNLPVKFDKEGTALVSGFSPAIAEAVLTADLEAAKNAAEVTPYDVMIEAVMKERYDL